MQRQLFICLLISLALSHSKLSDAAVYTVGAAGTHSDLNDAIAAAALTPADDEIRIRAGLVLSAAPYSASANSSDGALVISGGWSADYASVVAGANDALATVIDGANQPSPLRLGGTSGTLVVRGMHIRNGDASAFGEPGAVRLQIAGNAQVSLTGLRISNSITASTNGCLSARAAQQSAIAISNLRIVNCSNASANLNAAAVAATLVAFNDGTMTLRDIVIEGTEQKASNNANSGAALSLAAQDNARVESDLLEVSGTQSVASAVLGSAAYLSTSGTAQITLDRLSVHDNLAPNAPPSTAQLVLSQSDSSVVRIRNSMVFSGPQTGMALSFVGTTPRLHMSNLTIAGHAERGYTSFISAGAIATLHNSIVARNGLSSIALAGSNNLGANLGLAEPIFVTNNPIAALDYRLSANSPGIDQGTLSTPEALGPLDFVGNARISNGNVDIGAFELISDRLLANGFE